MKNFDEAINIKNADIDITTGERITHEEIYTRAINLLGGLDAIIPYMPFKLEKIQKALENGDKHLNTLPLHIWDFSADAYIKDLMYRKANITYSSVSERVCLLKEAARQWAKRGY